MGSDHLPTETTRRWRTLVTIGIVAALLVPVTGGRDGVPLSSYPMYAVPRGAEVGFVVAYGVDGAGGSTPLPIEVTAGTRDPLIAETSLRTAANGDAVATCEQIAARADTAFERIEIRTEVHDVVARSRGEVSLLSSSTLVACERP